MQNSEEKQILFVFSFLRSCNIPHIDHSIAAARCNVRSEMRRQREREYIKILQAHKSQFCKKIVLTHRKSMNIEASFYQQNATEQSRLVAKTTVRVMVSSYFMTHKCFQATIGRAKRFNVPMTQRAIECCATQHISC